MTANPTSDRLVLILAVLAHLGAGILYAAAGLVAPLWAILLLWALWIVLLWQLVRLWKRRPLMSLLRAATWPPLRPVPAPIRQRASGSTRSC